MTVEEYISPMLPAINAIAVERHRKHERTAEGKSDIRSLFNEEINKVREKYEAPKKKLQKRKI